MIKCIVHSVRSVSYWSFCPLSPQGLRFRSRASLHAFFLQNGEPILDINLFNFTASKEDEVATPSQVKQGRRKKKHTNGQQDNATKIFDPPPKKSKRAPSSLRRTKDKKEKSSVDPNQVNADIVPEEIPHELEVQAASSSTVDDITLQKSPQRVGLLRDKILRLTPTSNQQNALIVHKDKQAETQPSVQTLNVESATESENKGEDETQIHSRGDNKPNSELGAVANSHQDVEEEVLLPEITGGSCTQVRDSQNSKYDLHGLYTVLVKAEV